MCVRRARDAQLSATHARARATTLISFPQVGTRVKTAKAGKAKANTAKGKAKEAAREWGKAKGKESMEARV